MSLDEKETNFSRMIKNMTAEDMAELLVGNFFDGIETWLKQEAKDDGNY